MTNADSIGLINKLFLFRGIFLNYLEKLVRPRMTESDQLRSNLLYPLFCDTIERKQIHIFSTQHMKTYSPAVLNILKKENSILANVLMRVQAEDKKNSLKKKRGAIGRNRARIR